MLAQGTPPASPPAATPPAGADAGAPAAPAQPPLPEPRADVDVPLRARAQISVDDMRKQVDTYFAGMRDQLRHMVQLQDVARREKDVIKLNCVNDKLLQLKQLMNIADQAKTNLDEAVARGDEGARYHEFGRITIAHQQAQALGSEAENCVGQDLTFLGPTQVIVSEPELPEDPTAVVGPDFPIVEPLPVASPQV